LWLFRRELRFPAAFLLLPIGVATIWIANALRIVLLIAIGTAGWPAVALGGFHSQAGWISFSLIAIGLVALALRSRWFVAEAARDGASRPADATVAWLAPFVAVTATAMVTGAFAAGIDWLYPLRIAAAVVVLWAFRRQYAALVRSWTWSWWPILLGAITFGAWIALAPPTGSGAGVGAGFPSTEPLLWVALWAAFRVVGYVLVTPVVEELAFRAFLVQRLEESPIGRFSWGALLVSSVLFGALHGQMWIAGILAGVAFAVAFYRRRMIADAVMAHVVANMLLAVYASTTRQWAVWS
jgi:exosortase E/protease (VPEID-CTERM system)